MASSSRRLYLFLQLICISRISQNKVLADDCPFEKEVKCTFTESNDPGKKPVYFMSGRSPTTFIRCDPDPLPSYHLYPGGSGSTCQTFQYMFTENKIALSKKLQTQSQPAFKAVIEEGDVWAIKFKETVWKPFIAKDKTGSQKDIFAHSSSATSHLKLQDVFLFNFEIKEITFPTSDPFRSGPYSFQFNTGSNAGHSLIIENVHSVDIKSQMDVSRGIFGKSILSSKAVTLLKNAEGCHKVIVTPHNGESRVAKVLKLAKLRTVFRSQS